MARLTETTFDKIFQAYKDGTSEQLPPKLKEELERWNVADNLIRQFKKRNTIIALMKEKFKISESQVYRDMANAKKFFGSIHMSDKSFYTSFYAEQLEELANLARAKDDYKTSVLALKEAAEIRGLKNEDDISEVYLNLQPSKFVVVLKVEMNGSTRKIEYDFDRTHSIEDSEYEVLSSTLLNLPSVSEDEMKRMLNIQ